MNRNRVTRARQRKAANTVMLSLTGLLTALALVPLFWIIGYVLIRGGKNINLDFFIHLPRPLGMAGGGVLSAIEGTLVVTILAALFAIPPGVLAAFYDARYPNTPLGVALRFSTDVLAGIPSIVVGLFAYSAIVVPMGHYSGLAGGAALAVIMLPTIIRTTEEMLKLVPATLREASLGLGAPEWKTSLSVLFPAASSGILTGFLLALARAAGETAPLLMTTLGNERFDIGQIVRAGVQGHKSVFHHPLEHRQPASRFPAAGPVEICPAALSGAGRTGLGRGAGADAFCLDHQCHCAGVDPEPHPPHERVTPWK